MSTIGNNDFIDSDGFVPQKDERWRQVIESFYKEFGEDVYKAWISNLNLYSLSEYEIVMSVPTNFVRDWIKREYFNGVFKKINGEQVCIRKGIKQILLDFFPKLVSYEIIVDKNTEIANEFSDNSSNIYNYNTSGDFENKVVSISKNDNLYNIGTELNENYTFENFVVGQSNKLAYQICKSIVENKDINFGVNPLFLYGSVGLGKTHLCQAVAWKLRENKNKQIIYLSTERFMYLFIQALQNQNINDFKNRFRNVDTLIIDDIQFIVGKDKTQKEFFYTFDTLISEQKQIILACDRSPVYLENLDEKLKSRLNGGLIVDIKEADYQLRFDLIKKKSENLNLKLSKGLLEFIAENIDTNCREIEGCLKRLKINQDIMHIEIKKENIEEILFDNLSQSKKTITIEAIQKKVVEYFDISMDDLKSEKRVKNLVLARHVAMFLSKNLTNKSFPDIAKKFNNKNHATVIHAVNKIKTEMENNPEIIDAINIIGNSLK